MDDRSVAYFWNKFSDKLASYGLGRECFPGMCATRMGISRPIRIAGPKHFCTAG